MESLGNQIHRLISGYKDKLPSKARKFKYPQILWAQIPMHAIYGHYNDFKEKFNDAVKKICSLFKEMDTFKLDDWIPDQLEYFSEGRINGNGLAAYWQAVDQAFEHWDRAQMAAATAAASNTISKLKKTVKPRKRSPKFKTSRPTYYHHHFVQNHRHNDRFHWTAPADLRFKLPSHRRIHHR